MPGLKIPWLLGLKVLGLLRYFQYFIKACIIALNAGSILANWLLAFGGFAEPLVKVTVLAQSGRTCALLTLPELCDTVASSIWPS